MALSTKVTIGYNLSQADVDVSDSGLFPRLFDRRFFRWRREVFLQLKEFAETEFFGRLDTHTCRTTVDYVEFIAPDASQPNGQIEKSLTGQHAEIHRIT